MKHLDILQKQNRMLKHLSSLPRQIMRLQGAENVSEFVLHDLSHEHCFDFDKAAFFVDNPDFNCTKGVAGFSRKEVFGKCEAIWDNPQEFTRHMKASSFNTHVRSLMRCSLKKGEEAHHELADTLAKDLGFKHYAFCSWDMPYDNHGFIVYEQGQACDIATQEDIFDGLSLLGFCPVF
jgi:hypothetical protein